MIVRPTARVIALEPGGRVLLLRCDINHGTGVDDGGGGLPRIFWLLPGGGVEVDETF
jgi:ADP-ribose pyrophosphatase YjhB (NUDIX family)